MYIVIILPHRNKHNFFSTNWYLLVTLFPYTPVLQPCLKCLNDSFNVLCTYIKEQFTHAPGLTRLKIRLLKPSTTWISGPITNRILLISLLVCTIYLFPYELKITKPRPSYCSIPSGIKYLSCSILGGVRVQTKDIIV